MSDLFPAVVETERLRPECLGPDATDVREFYGTVWPTDRADAVFEHVPQDVHAHPKETRKFVAEAGEYWAEGEGAQWLVRPREGEDGAGTPAGVTSLAVDWDCRRAGIGLLLDEPFWGRGYSGERAAALLALAFDRLDLAVVTVDHTVNNENSRSAVEKYIDRFGGPASEASGTSSRAQRSDGGRRDGEIRNYQPRDDTVDDVIRYSVTADQWADNRPDDHHCQLAAEP